LGTSIRTKLATVVKDGSFCEQFIVSIRDHAVSWMETRDGTNAIRNICYTNAPFVVVPYADFQYQPSSMPSSSPSIEGPTQAPTAKPTISTGSFIGFLVVVALIAIMRFSPSLVDVVASKEKKDHLYNILVVIDDHEDAILQNIRHSDILYFRRTIFADTEEDNHVPDWIMNKTSELLEKRFEVRFLDSYGLMGHTSDSVVASNSPEIKNDTDSKKEIESKKEIREVYIHQARLITGMIVKVKEDMGKDIEGESNKTSSKTSNSEKFDSQKGSILDERRGSIFGGNLGNLGFLGERKGSTGDIKGSIDNRKGSIDDRKGSIFGGNLGFILGDRRGSSFGGNLGSILDDQKGSSFGHRKGSIGSRRGSVRRRSVIDSNSVGIDMLLGDVDFDKTGKRRHSTKGIRRGSIMEGGFRRGSVIDSSSLGIDVQSSDMDIEKSDKRRLSSKGVRRGSIMEGVRRGSIFDSNIVRFDIQSSDVDIDMTDKRRHSTKGVRRGSIMEGVRRLSIIDSNSVGIDLQSSKDSVDFDKVGKRRHSTKEVRRGSIMEGVRRGSYIRSKSIGIGLLSGGVDIDKSAKRRNSVQGPRIDRNYKSSRSSRKEKLVMMFKHDYEKKIITRRNSLRDERKNSLRDDYDNQFFLEEENNQVFLEEEKENSGRLNGKL
jgi:hypothetical protein